MWLCLVSRIDSCIGMSHTFSHYPIVCRRGLKEPLSMYGGLRFNEAYAQSTSTEPSLPKPETVLWISSDSIR